MECALLVMTLRVVWRTHQWSDWVYCCVWMIQYDWIWEMPQVSCISKLLPFISELLIFYLDILSVKDAFFFTRCVWYNCAESTNFIVFVTLIVQEEYQGWPCTGILKPLDCWKWRQFIQSEHWEPTTQQHGIISQKNCGHSHAAMKISSPAHLNL
jgi:hypothetical protein